MKSINIDILSVTGENKNPEINFTLNIFKNNCNFCVNTSITKKQFEKTFVGTNDTLASEWVMETSNGCTLSFDYDEHGDYPYIPLFISDYEFIFTVRNENILCSVVVDEKIYEDIRQMLIIMCEHFLIKK